MAKGGGDTFKDKNHGGLYKYSGNPEGPGKKKEEAQRGIEILWSRRLKGDLIATLCKGQKGLFITIKQKQGKDKKRITIIPVDLELLLILHKEAHEKGKEFGLGLK